MSTKRKCTAKQLEALRKGREKLKKKCKGKKADCKTKATITRANKIGSGFYSKYPELVKDKK